MFDTFLFDSVEYGYKVKKYLIGLERKDKKNFVRVCKFIEIIKFGKEIDKRYKTHKYHKKEGYFISHIRHDLVIIWARKKEGTIVIEDIGTHQKVF